MNTRFVRILPLVTGLLLMGGCSSGDSDVTTPPADNDPPPPTTGGETSVDVRDDIFAPSSATVDPGDRVHWTWSGNNEHNVTWEEADLTDSPTQTSGSHQVTMPESSGEYVYYCTVHGTPSGGMNGTITVR